MKTKRLDTIRSPLRYPGGKHTLAPFIEQIMIANGLFWKADVLETHAGGAGVGLYLLQSGAAQSLWINDADPVIANFWQCATSGNHSEVLSHLQGIQNTDEAVRQQKRIIREYRCGNHTESEITAASILFVNRVCYCGIIKAGPSSGRHRRYSYTEMCHRIQAIAKMGITVTQRDAVDMFTLAVQKPYPVFVYLDPPYVGQGKNLYPVFYHENDHRRLAETLTRHPNTPWVLSYDDHPLIHSLYPADSIRRIDSKISISLERKKQTELLIKSPCLTWPV